MPRTLRSPAGVIETPGIADSPPARTRVSTSPRCRSRSRFSSRRPPSKRNPACARAPRRSSRGIDRFDRSRSCKIFRDVYSNAIGGLTARPTILIVVRCFPGLSKYWNGVRIVPVSGGGNEPEPHAPVVELRDPEPHAVADLELLVRRVVDPRDELQRGAVELDHRHDERHILLHPEGSAREHRREREEAAVLRQVDPLHRVAVAPGAHDPGLPEEGAAALALPLREAALLEVLEEP